MGLRAGCILELADLYDGKICVAVIGTNRDFAVYLQQKPDQYTAELVARHGGKVSALVGRALFPELSEYGYRL